MHIDPIKNSLEDILETMAEGLMIIGPNGRIRMVNEAMAAITGYSREELTGQPCTMLQCDVCAISRQKGREHWCALFDTRREPRKRCRIIRKDGASVPVIKNARLLMDGDNVIAAVETLTDISELDAQKRRIDELTRLFDTGFHGMVGHAPAMQRLYGILERAAASDAPVIISGESGTGKELAAYAIHALGPRSDGPFIQCNCAALNESILESELFGHVKGAFTGAIRHREGRFEAARGGDIFLDEIGDVPLSIQVKLLRVLESKRIERVGDNRPITVDARIITATNRNLERLTQEGRFRRDFYYRINVIPIHIPPLRERAEDIPLLADFFLHDISQRSGADIAGIAPETMRRLMAHRWPGNVRELKSALEYACVIADAGPILPEHLPPSIMGDDATCPPPVDTTPLPHHDAQRAESLPPLRPADPAAPREGEAHHPAGPRAQLVSALRATGGNKAAAARLLGVSRGTVHNRIRKYAVDVSTVILD